MAEVSEAYGLGMLPLVPTTLKLIYRLAETIVKTVKGLLEHSKDPYKALLNYRVTPLPWFSLSVVKWGGK